MSIITLKIDERTKIGKAVMELIKSFSFESEGVEIISCEEQYEPGFVAKIRKAEKQKSIEVNPHDLWGSIGLK